MATGVEKEVNCSLINAGTLTLEDTTPRPLYSGIVVSMNMIAVIDWRPRKVRLHRLLDGKLMASTAKMESVPSAICLLNDAEIGVILWNGLIQILPIESTSKTGIITPNRAIRVNGGLDQYHGIVKYNDNLLACGRIQDMMYWCIVSLNNGHVDSIHQICKGNWWTYLTTKNNMIYISCNGGRGSSNTGVYGYDILNTSQRQYTYKHQDLMWPTVITTDKHGFIFVCNHLYPFDCIHHLTDKCQPVSIFKQGIPPRLDALFWDEPNRHLYVTADLSTTITRYRPEYKGSIIPVEILRMDEQSIQLYKEALRDGKEKVYNIRVMVVGPYGVGKTTLTKRLLGQHVDISKRKSTEGIDVHKHCCIIPLDTGEWILQHEDSDQLARLQRIWKRLTDQTEKKEVSGEQGDRGQIIYQNDLSDSDEDDIPTSTKVTYHNIVTDTKDDNVPTGSESDIHLNVDLNSSDSGKPVTNTADATLEFLQMVNAKADKLNKRIVEYASLAIWDFAGQYVFYTTHQTFLTCRAIYLLVTDLSQQITDLVENDEYYFDTEGVKSHQVKDLVEVWLNSIHCCEPSQAVGSLGTSAAADIKASPQAAGIRMTPSAADITVTSPVGDNTLPYPATGITVTSLTGDITVTVPAAGINVKSLTSDITVRSPASDITLTSPTANHKGASSAADTTESYPTGDITLKSSGDITPLASSDVGIAAAPPVIIVGTHVDKIKEEKRQEVIKMYFPQICRILNDKPALRHVSKFFATDNTQLDPQLQALKDQIFQLAKEQPYWGEEVPVSWLPMEEALMKLKSFGKKVIALSLVEEINQAASVPIKTAEQLDLFLRFQHEIGTILYFSVDGLKEKIVLDPQWFIDALKSLITAEMFILENYPAIRNKWFELKDKGKLAPELIDAIWTRENKPEFYENKEHLLLVMEKLNIIAKPRIYTEGSEQIKVENYYLAPCMLRQKTPVEVICPKPNDQMESSSVLCYIFMGQFMPPPIFHRLLAACVAHWPISTRKKEETQENMIFCGCCVFQLDHHHKLILYFREHIIFVRVIRMGIKKKIPSSKLCIEVREFVTTNLLKIIGYLGQSLKFEYFIQCPEYNGESVNTLIPVSLLKEYAEVHCDFHENIIESCKVLKFWFEDQVQSGNRDACHLLSDHGLSYIASRLGAEWKFVALNLDLTQPEIERIQMDMPGKTLDQICKALATWLNRSIKKDHENILQLLNAIEEVKRNDLVFELKEMFHLQD